MISVVVSSSFDRCSVFASKVDSDDADRDDETAYEAALALV
jgi:hypothetical protein